MSRMPTIQKLPALLGCCGMLLCSSAATLRAGDSSPQLGGNRNSGQPLNLARTHLGTRLDIQSAAGTADAAAATAALLHDDDPLGYPLAEGTTSVTLTLPKIEVVNRFNFLNLTAAGHVAISVSSARQPEDGKGWRRVQEMVFDGSDVVTCDLGSVEARYVKIDFQIEKAGRVDTFGLFGLPTLNAQGSLPAVASAKEAGQEKRLLMFNYAVSSSQAGVIMVSPGEDINRAQALADGDVGSSFSFKTTDAQPMAVVDLGETRTLNRVGASFKAGPGHMDVYLLPDPQNQSDRKARTIQEIIASDFPAGRQLVLSTDTGKQTGLTRTGANVNGQSGRYLVMVFHPAGGTVPAEKIASTDFKDYKDFKDGHDAKDSVTTAQTAPAVSATPLEVSEITAFGNLPPGAYAQQTTPNFPGSLILGASTLTPPGAGTGTNAPNPPPILPPSAGGNTVTP